MIVTLGGVLSILTAGEVAVRLFPALSVAVTASSAGARSGAADRARVGEEDAAASGGKEKSPDRAVRAPACAALRRSYFNWMAAEALQPAATARTGEDIEVEQN